MAYSAPAKSVFVSACAAVVLLTTSACGISSSNPEASTPDPTAPENSAFPPTTTVNETAGLPTLTPEVGETLQLGCDNAGQCQWEFTLHSLEALPECDAEGDEQPEGTYLVKGVTTTVALGDKAIVDTGGDADGAAYFPWTLVESHFPGENDPMPDQSIACSDDDSPILTPGPLPSGESITQTFYLDVVPEADTLKLIHLPHDPELATVTEFDLPRL